MDTQLLEIIKVNIEIVQIERQAGITLQKLDVKKSKDHHLNWRFKALARQLTLTPKDRPLSQKALISRSSKKTILIRVDSLAKPKLATSK
jgi:hypothetical protein